MNTQAQRNVFTIQLKNFDVVDEFSGNDILNILNYKIIYLFIIFTI